MFDKIIMELFNKRVVSMSDTNNLEIIQNKLDALIEKIVQKENLDENFRITYAQILEKINTKMDLFSGNENNDKVGVITSEIKDAIQERQNIVDDNFVSIKSDFDNLKETLLASLENQELINTLENLQNQINKFSEEQENQNRCMVRHRPELHRSEAY